MKAPPATLWCQPQRFLLTLIFLWISRAFTVSLYCFFVLRKRLRKTLFHERKKCLCVRMNEHSVLLKPGGDWRRPCQPHVLTLTLRGVSPQTSTKKITDVPSCLYPLERVLWAINLQDNPLPPQPLYWQWAVSNSVWQWLWLWRTRNTCRLQLWPVGGSRGWLFSG